MYKTCIKPTLDILAALVGLIVLSPLILVTIITLWITNRGEVFFIQMRPGYKGKLFPCFKFKTMSDSRDEKGELLPDSVRLTPIGKFIRRCSLDEILQLVNILRGEMSLIGPRPLLTEYLPLYSKTQARRHEVKPGITGLAQVRGRNLLSWNDKFTSDVEYVDTLSAKLDLIIAWETLCLVFMGTGVSAKNSATAEKFQGGLVTTAADDPHDLKAHG